MTKNTALMAAEGRPATPLSIPLPILWGQLQRVRNGCAAGVADLLAFALLCVFLVAVLQEAGGHAHEAGQGENKACTPWLPGCHR